MPGMVLPTLGGEAARRADARLSGFLCLLFGFGAVLVHVDMSHRTVQECLGLLLVAAGTRLLVLAESVAGWELSLTSAVFAVLLAVVATTSHGSLSTAASLTYVVAGLQIALLRSRGEAWAQLWWEMGVYVFALSWTAAWPGSVWPWLALAGVLALLTAAATSARRGLDGLLAELNPSRVPAIPVPRAAPAAPAGSDPRAAAAHDPTRRAGGDPVRASHPAGDAPGSADRRQTVEHGPGIRVRVNMPPLGSRANRQVDARFTGGFCLSFGLLSTAVGIGLDHSPFETWTGVLAVALALVFLLRPDRVPPWALSLTNVLLSAGIAVGSTANHGTAGNLAPSILVIIVLQLSALRSRREAWLQFGWASAAYLGALVITAGWGGLPIWSAQTCVLAVLTAVGTWTRAGLDELVGELHYQADHDSLTGVLNREGLRRIEERRGGDRRRALPARAGPEPSAAVLLVDIDYFKAINDDWGHPAGDEVLVWLGGILRGFVRGSEQVSRYGGEEFLLVIPDLDLAGAVKRAERLRLLVASGSLSAPHPITVSIGVAVGPTTTNPDGLGGLYARADAAMYKAKQGGRDRVEVSDEVIPLLAGS